MSFLGLPTTEDDANKGTRQPVPPAWSDRLQLLVMADRVRFFHHEGKRILLVDLSNCSAREAEETTRRVPDSVTAEPRGSVRILTDFTRGSFDAAALRAIKETAVFDKPYVRKSALIGTLSLPREFHDEITKFSRREFAIFGTREEALKWLAQD